MLKFCKALSTLAKMDSKTAEVVMTLKVGFASRIHELKDIPIDVQPERHLLVLSVPVGTAFDGCVDDEQDNSLHTQDCEDNKVWLHQMCSLKLSKFNSAVARQACLSLDQQEQNQLTGNTNPLWAWTWANQEGIKLSALYQYLMRHIKRQGKPRNSVIQELKTTWFSGCVLRRPMSATSLDSLGLGSGEERLKEVQDIDASDFADSPFPECPFTSDEDCCVEEIGSENEKEEDEQEPGEEPKEEDGYDDADGFEDVMSISSGDETPNAPTHRVRGKQSGDVLSPQATAHSVPGVVLDCVRSVSAQIESNGVVDSQKIKLDKRREAKLVAVHRAAKKLVAIEQAFTTGGDKVVKKNNAVNKNKEKAKVVNMTKNKDKVVNMHRNKGKDKVVVNKGKETAGSCDVDASIEHRMKTASFLTPDGDIPIVNVRIRKFRERDIDRLQVREGERTIVTMTVPRFGGSERAEKICNEFLNMYCRGFTKAQINILKKDIETSIATSSA